nr:MAG TPA: hypothetical protein [Crassvirales sp.]
MVYKDFIYTIIITLIKWLLIILFLYTFAPLNLKY